jgi:predicted amidohydrolase YtcJ
MQVAVTRENPDKSNLDYQGRLGDDPGLDIETAIRAFTINAAYEIKMEDRVGSLEVGKYADMIVIGQDITKADPFDIAGTKVLMTFVGGREVYRDPSV